MNGNISESEKKEGGVECFCNENHKNCHPAFLQETPLCHHHLVHNKSVSESNKEKVGTGGVRNNNDHRQNYSSSESQGQRQPMQRRRGFCDKIEEQLEHLGKGTTWLGVFLGQVLSGIMCVSAITTVYLVDVYKIHLPNAQNFGSYLCLAAIFTTILACRPGERNLFPILKTRGWKYALVALVDAEANFLVVKSYQFTTLTSVQLLDCFTIPTVLSLSWLVLRIRFKVPHIVGVSICLLGVCCLVWADIEEGRPLAEGKDRFVGDMICLSGAFLYGFSNVAQEFVVKTFDVVEFLGMIGLFGSFVSGIQTVVLEYPTLMSIDWSSGYSTQIILLITFASAQFLFYIVSAIVIKLSSATAFNLSILTADFYSLIVGIYLFHFKFHALYFLSFVLVMTGVIVFAIKPTQIDSHVYRSLTREHTTTLDLELMASTPASNSNSGYHLHNSGDKSSHYEFRRGSDGEHRDISTGKADSLLYDEKSHPNDNAKIGMSFSDRNPVLSNQSCDVVLQTTMAAPNGNSHILGRGSFSRNGDTNGKSGFDRNGTATYVIPEDEAC